MTNTLVESLLDTPARSGARERELSDGDRDWEPFYDVFDPEFDDPPPPPPWVLQACAERDRDRLAHAAIRPVDIESLTALVGADPSTLAADALLDAIAASQRLINHTQALQQRYLAALARPGVATPLESLVDAALHPTGHQGELSYVLTSARPNDLPVDGNGDVDYTPLLEMPVWRDALTEQASRFASAEVSCLLGFAPITARLRIENALVMVDELPATLATQERGDLDGYRASIIADRTSVLSPELRCEVESRILPFATERTSGALRRIADREVIAADTAAAERHTRGPAVASPSMPPTTAWPRCASSPPRRIRPWSRAYSTRSPPPSAPPGGEPAPRRRHGRPVPHPQPHGPRSHRHPRRRSRHNRRRRRVARHRHPARDSHQHRARRRPLRRPPCHRRRDR